MAAEAAGTRRSFTRPGPIISLVGLLASGARLGFTRREQRIGRGGTAIPLRIDGYWREGVWQGVLRKNVLTVGSNEV